MREGHIHHFSRIQEYLGFDKSPSDKHWGSEVLLVGVIGDYSYAIPQHQSLEGLFPDLRSVSTLLWEREIILGAFFFPVMLCTDVHPQGGSREELHSGFALPPLYPKNLLLLRNSDPGFVHL